jgi:hypothetical protein
MNWFAALLLILVSTGSAAQPRPEPNASFERFVLHAKQRSNAEQPVYFNSRLSLWAKRKFTISELKYEIKGSDSSEPKFIGMASFNLSVSQSSLVSSKESADRLSEFGASTPIVYNIALNYLYKENEWVFADGVYTNTLLKNVKINLTVEGLRREPTAIPYAGIIYWIEP